MFSSLREKGSAVSAMTLEEADALVDTIDLEPISYLLTIAHGGYQAHSQAHADHLITMYRRFLALNLLYPELTIVPTDEMDEVWHTHILDTAKYDADCDMLFGAKLHHFPYLGHRGEADLGRFESASKTTNELIRKHFGAADPGDGDDDGDSSWCCVPRGSNALEEVRPVPVRVKN